MGRPPLLTRTRGHSLVLLLAGPGAASASLGISSPCPESLEHEVVIAGLSQALGSSKVLQTGGSSMWGRDAFLATDTIHVASYI